MSSRLSVASLAIGFLCFVRAHAAEQAVVYCTMKGGVAQFIDFLLRSEIQKLLSPRLSRPSESTADREILAVTDIKAMEVDYVKLVAQSKELSRGFLKEWVGKQK